MTTADDKTFFETLTREKPLIFDGGMGSMLQTYDLSLDDFAGLEGCNEMLCKTRPDVVKEIHAAYYDAGADVVETNSFGSTSIVLAEYDIAEQAYELSKLSAELAKEVAKSYTDKPRYVAGSIGPSTKLPTLGHMNYPDMKVAYESQIQGLVDGGADMLLIETCQDLLQTKAALTALMAVRKNTGRRVPTMVQVTIEQMGTMLVGSDISTVVASLSPYDIDVLGMNCATGPEEMIAHVRYLSNHSPFIISCLPNAGIPENVGGVAHYHLTPEELANYHKMFVEELGVSIVGGCCGTTPAHIKTVKDTVGNIKPATREPEQQALLTSLYTTVPMKIDQPPVLVGERTNANGSKKFRELLQADDYDALVSIGKEQVKKGAHLLDLCTAYVGRDEVKDMSEAVTRFNSQLDVPIMIDSTEVPVIRAALELIAGRAIINSINLEDGEERAREVLALCQEFGAAVVALTIDEDGMAKTSEKKLEIAKRIYNLAVGEYSLKPDDLVFDTLTFTLGSGDEEFRKAGIETIDAIEAIKKELPGVGSILGISNISFGLNPSARHVINSVFLSEAIKKGLDMAIVNSAHIIPLHTISDKERELCNELVYDKRKFDGDKVTYDPLTALMAYFDEHSASSASKKEEALPEQVEERLKYRIIHGEKEGLNEDLDEALKNYKALDIINIHLLNGMKVVGDLFGAGEMQLPFVLQSAEVMKAAVAYLEPYMEKSEGDTSKGTLVLATVKGDVHDIGKNLVDIILTNNGYKVINLGIKQPIDTILKALEESNAHAIGMSGLLVKSTAIMKENLEIMTDKKLTVPVILGGAALTPKFVEEDCQNVYGGKVYYTKDAFAGLHAMESIMNGDTAIEEKVLVGVNAATAEETGYQAVGEVGQSGLSPDSPDYFKRADVKEDVLIPNAPFWGSKIVDNIPLEEVFPFLNLQTLTTGQWQVRRGKRSSAEHKAYLEENIYPIVEQLKEKTASEKLLEPKIIYGYYPVQSDKNDVIVYKPDVYEKSGDLVEWQRFHFPRGGKKKLCLADYVATIESNRVDILPMQIVTVGRKASEHAQKLFESDNYSQYLYFHGFSVEIAEAMAEYWHQKVRLELEIAGEDATEIKKLLACNYQGRRYSFGYPACPDLEDQKQLFEILDPGRIDIDLSEEFMLEPEQSTSAIILHHPEATYFDVREK